ncbi:MAG: serine/threonine-protein kinase, partial [Acidobacteriota bacterium]
MTSELPRGIEDERKAFALLAEVCELDPDARERALDAFGDPRVAAEVRRKLGARDSLAGWLETPPPGEGHRPVQIGDTVGPFEVRGLLGEGGMGQVFRAVQRRPVRRDVALKIMRLGQLHADARVRFAAERQAMARLDHPNVGRILEAGTTEEGQPYFAMELIDGQPITAHCDRRRLSIEERLRLFQEVCRGTHHAHLKLLLHRDLKPSNVLVLEVDGRPVPKIIDFGIAKGLGTPLVTAAAATGDRFLGTPAYMSP